MRFITPINWRINWRACRAILLGFGVGVLLTVLLCWLSGCAAGRNDASGEIVVGVGVGRLTESANQALTQLGDLVLPGAGGAIGILGAVGIGWARSYATARAAAAQRDGERKGWDEAAVAHSPAIPTLPVALAVAGSGAGAGVAAGVSTNSPEVRS